MTKLRLFFSFAILQGISNARVTPDFLLAEMQGAKMSTFLDQKIRNFHISTSQALTMNTDSRRLQRTVEEVCQQYNLQLSNSNFTDNTMTCVCTTLAQDEIFVDCLYDQPACQTHSENNLTACIDGGFGLTLNSAGDHYKTKSCFNVTTSEVPQATCVEVVTSTPRDFSTVESCAASLNGEECNYCEVCQGNTLTVDCCNVMDDKRQRECRAVTGNGGFTPIFDIVNSPGQCTGVNTYDGRSFGVVSSLSIMILLLSGLQMLI